MGSEQVCVYECASVHFHIIQSQPCQQASVNTVTVYILRQLKKKKYAASDYFKIPLCNLAA